MCVPQKPATSRELGSNPPSQQPEYHGVIFFHHVSRGDLFLVGVLSGGRRKDAEPPSRRPLHRTSALSPRGRIVQKTININIKLMFNINKLS